MRLKSIEMQGFKSFADKIYLDFNPGITAIVGPNGSGKSNISDAIRWVMGEQSVKSLRGSKMEDVIFSGTEARKAVGFAEVTLVLDNSDNYFSLDFPEITVTRRVYRSGEGEYYINKTLCRLKDIHELFMDTGLGRDGYSIIGQGKIDSILSTKSEDRRQIFEEASGISKYKYRKIEAERKLLQTNDNLTRIEDILGELESQLGPLERQSEKAKKYLLLRDEMRGLDIGVSVITAENSKKELEILTEDISILSAQIDEIKKGLEKTDEEISQMYTDLGEYDQKTEGCRNLERETNEQINEHKNNINLFLSDIEHNKQNIQRLEEEVKSGAFEIERIDKDLQEHRNILDELNVKKDAAAEALEKLIEESKAADTAAGDKNSVLESLRGDIVELNSSINSLKSSILNLQVLGESFSSRKKVIESEILDKSRNKDSLTKEYNERKNLLASAEDDASKSEQVVFKLQQEASSAEKEIEDIRQELNRQNSELNRRVSRQNMLRDMENEFEGYNRGVKGVMTAYKEGKIPGSEIYGPLAQLIKTDKQYIVAIETALGGVNQNIVTETEDDAKEAIGYLKGHKLGRATFLPISAIKPKKFDSSSVKGLKGFISVASDLIECDKKYKDIVSNFLGTTVVCDKLDNAVAMAKKSGHKFKIVTLDGDIIQAGGAMTGGSMSKTTGSLSRAGEIETLTKEIERIQKSAEAQEKKQQQLLTRIDEIKAELTQENHNLVEKKQEVVKYQSELKHYEVMLENVDSASGRLDTELEEIINREAEIKEDISKKQLEIEEKTKISKTTEKDLAEAQREYTELAGKNERLISQLTELNLAQNTTLKDIELQNDRIARLNTEKSQYLDATAAKNSGIQMFIQRNTDITAQIEQTKATVEVLEQALIDYREQITQLSSGRTELEEKIRKRQESVKDVQEQMFQLTQRQGKMEAKATKFELEIESVISRLWEEYELTYSEAVELKPQNDDFDFKAASAKIRELREQIKALGNINIDAIEEYKNIKERFDFLTVQTADLQKAKAELESVIDEMLTIMQSRFAEQFKVINQNFNKTFSALFGGGRAELSLTDPENILESGIEIEAQPPGKKLQSLTLLSGGERAFTAIALLFAILDVRPTPFCILDEIEAALDDVNVYRYADYLKKYSNKTQFIVVTHRRGTMEAANILYGVTMQERGISKLLSLDIDEVQS